VRQAGVLQWVVQPCLEFARRVVGVIATGRQNLAAGIDNG
jgi:hypothetical protein